MAITVEQTLLNNQSILEKITLVEEIDAQAAEIISGGKFGNFLPQEIHSFDEPDAPKPGEEEPDPIPEEEIGASNSKAQSMQLTNFALGRDIILRIGNRNRNRNRYVR